MDSREVSVRIRQDGSSTDAFSVAVIAAFEDTSELVMMATTGLKNAGHGDLAGLDLRLEGETGEDGKCYAGSESVSARVVFAACMEYAKGKSPRLPSAWKAKEEQDGRWTLVLVFKTPLHSTSGRRRGPSSGSSARPSSGSSMEPPTNAETEADVKARAHAVHDAMGVFGLFHDLDAVVCGEPAGGMYKLKGHLQTGATVERRGGF